VCILEVKGIFMWETIVHQFLPNLIIIIASITLLIRVVWQKRRVNQPLHWRKHRKMTLQLFTIALLYLIFCCPNTVLILSYLFDYDMENFDQMKFYAEFFSYFLILLFPFVCLCSVHELYARLKRLFQGRQRRVTGVIN
jgi:phosphatidylglycerophosphate synthase